MNIKSIIAVVAGVVLLTSCEYQKYNRKDQADTRANSEWVYGVHPDSSAKQLSYKYTEKPELELKANELRQKLYGDAKVYKK